MNSSCSYCGADAGERPRVVILWPTFEGNTGAEVVGAVWKVACEPCSKRPYRDWCLLGWAG